MKKLFRMMILILIIFNILYSKDSTNVYIKDNSKCLQFQISNDFRLSSFQGSTISFKKHTQNSRAYRFGVTTYGEIRDLNDLTDSNTDSLDTRKITDNDNFVLDITGQYLKYVPHKHTYFYYGFGPHIIFTKRYQRQQREDYTNSDWELESTLNRYDSKSIQIGLIFVAGVELFISKSFSVHSEYSQEISYYYYWRKQLYSNYDLIENYNVYSFDSGGVKFGCSFYL